MWWPLYEIQKLVSYIRKIESNAMSIHLIFFVDQKSLAGGWMPSETRFFIHKKPQVAWQLLIILNFLLAGLIGLDFQGRSL